MCGRYVFFDGKNEKIQKLINLAQKKIDHKKYEQIALGEVFPGCNAFVGIQDANGLHTHIMKWGFSSSHGLIINARSETAFTSPFFAGCIPCAAIASAYFEWSPKHEKTGFYVQDETMYLAGLAHQEKDGMHYVILTEEATGSQRLIHDRQPVVFSYENARKWCNSTQPASLLMQSLQNRIAYKA